MHFYNIALDFESSLLAIESFLQFSSLQFTNSGEDNGKPPEKNSPRKILLERVFSHLALEKEKFIIYIV